MIQFLVDGEWCSPSFADTDPPALRARDDGYWENYNWTSLLFLSVTHIERGHIKIAPMHYPWRFR